MKQIIKLQDIFGEELYTRSRAAELRSYVDNNADEVVLDMKGIAFTSRSFADEICNLIDSMKDKCFLLTNQTEDVKTMISKVSESRNRERIHGIANANMLEFSDMESLSSYLRKI